MCHESPKETLIKIKHVSLLKDVIFIEIFPLGCANIKKLNVIYVSQMFEFLCLDINLFDNSG